MIILLHHNQSVLHKGRFFTANSGTKAAVLPKGRSSSTNSGTKVAVLLEMNRCCSSLLLSAPHSLFSIWTYLRDLKRSQGHQHGAEESEFGLSGLHRNSPWWLNISSIRVFNQIRVSEIPITLRPLTWHNHSNSLLLNDLLYYIPTNTKQNQSQNLQYTLWLYLIILLVFGLPSAAP